DTLKVQPNQIEERLGRLLAQLKQAEKTIAEMKAGQLSAIAADLMTRGVDRGATRFIAAVDPGVGLDLRGLATDLRARLGSTAGVVCLVATSPKPSVVIATTQAARDSGLKAGQLVGLAAAAMGGRGGGSADLAQGGGTDPSGAQAALDAVAEAIG
ncbi:MAG: alanine--tRNA ligase, partial [Propionibacteriaceae bacterium]|nr:alanine--tRNA ligase [Propionibacteriaceae bacterium]